MLVLFVLHLILNVYCDLPDTALNTTAQKQLQALEQAHNFLNELQKEIQESRDLLKSIPSDSLLNSTEIPKIPLRTAPTWITQRNLFRFLSSTVAEDSSTPPSTTSFISPPPGLPEKFLEARDYVLPDVGPEYRDIFMPDMERRGETDKEAMAAVTLGLNMLFVTQPAPGEVLLGEVAFHTTTADPHPTLHNMLVKDVSGYISVGFEMFCMLVAEKDPGSVKAVLERSGTVIIRMEHERHDRFQWMNQPLRTVVNNMAGMVGPNTLQVDELQTKARLMRETMKNRREVLSDYVNRILDFADGLVKLEEGEAIFDVLDAFREFPKPDKEGKNRTAEQMCEDLISAFSKPFYLETLDRRRLISATNRALRERFAHLNLFRRQATRGSKTDDRQRASTNSNKYDFKQAWYTQPNSRIPIYGHKFSISHRNRAIYRDGFRRSNKKDQKNHSKNNNKVKPTRNSMYRRRMNDGKANDVLGKQKTPRAQRRLVPITNKKIAARHSIYQSRMNNGKVNEVLGKQKIARTQRRLPLANKNVLIARNSVYRKSMIPIANKHGMTTPNSNYQSTMIPIFNKNGIITQNSISQSTMYDGKVNSVIREQKTARAQRRLPISNKNVIARNSIYRSTLNDGKVNEVREEQERARIERRLEPIMYTRKTINFHTLNDAKVAQVHGAQKKAETQGILVAVTERKTKSLYAKPHIDAKEVTKYKNIYYGNPKLRPTVFRRYNKHQINLATRLKDTNQSNTEIQNKFGTESKIQPTTEIKTTRLVSKDVEINKTDDLRVSINQSDERIVLDVKLLNRILNVTSEESMTDEKLLDGSVATDNDEEMLKNLYDAFYN